MNKRKLILNKYGIKYLVNDNNDPFMYNTIDVAKCLNIMKTSELVRYHRLRKYLSLQPNQPVPTYLNSNDMLKLLSIVRHVIPRDLYTGFGLASHALVLTTEQTYIGIILNSYKDILDIKLQYVVGCYKIDAYIPELNLAIECDEFGHDEADQSYEIRRQSFIEQSLGCKFLRFNPHDNNFDISGIINSINKMLIEHIKTDK